MNEAEKENKENKENKIPAMNSFKKLNNLVLKELKKSNEFTLDKEKLVVINLAEITSTLVNLFE